jgi:hypothetical protein
MPLLYFIKQAGKLKNIYFVQSSRFSVFPLAKRSGRNKLKFEL